MKPAEKQKLSDLAVKMAEELSGRAPGLQQIVVIQQPNAVFVQGTIDPVTPTVLAIMKSAVDAGGALLGSVFEVHGRGTVKYVAFKWHPQIDAQPSPPWFKE